MLLFDIQIFNDIKPFILLIFLKTFILIYIKNTILFRKFLDDFNKRQLQHHDRIPIFESSLSQG